MTTELLLPQQKGGADEPSSRRRIHTAPPTISASLGAANGTPEDSPLLVTSGVPSPLVLYIIGEDVES